MLAQSIARGLGMPLIVWNIKSTTKAQDGLYVYDTVQRLYDGQFGDGDVRDIARYIRLGKLGEAFPRRSASCCSSTRSTRPTSSSPTTCCGSSTRWSSTSPRRTRRSAAAAAGRGHHLQRREGAARRLPAALRLPLHRVPRRRDDGAHRARAPPRPRAAPAGRSPCRPSTGCATSPGLQKKPSTSELIDWVRALAARRRAARRHRGDACRSSACC